MRLYGIDVSFRQPGSESVSEESQKQKKLNKIGTASTVVNQILQDAYKLCTVFEHE